MANEYRSYMMMAAREAGNVCDFKVVFNAEPLGGQLVDAAGLTANLVLVHLARHLPTVTGYKFAAVKANFGWSAGPLL